MNSPDGQDRALAAAELLFVSSGRGSMTYRSMIIDSSSIAAAAAPVAAITCRWLLTIAAGVSSSSMGGTDNCSIPSSADPAA